MESQNDKTLAFFGKMTANLTHEVKNILAIIQESAGLMEDICALSPMADKAYQDKFASALRSIKTQLQRGMELTTRFNRFAHLPDHSRSEIELAEAVAQIRSLAERFARLKYIELTTDSPQDSGIRMATRPTRFYMALFFAIESCLAVLPAQSRITLTTGQRNDIPAVGIHCGGAEKLPAPEAFFGKLQESASWDDLSAAIAQLDGKIEPDSKRPGMWLVFG